jgi:hypothetical protein
VIISDLMTMPAVGVGAISFEPQRVDYLSPETGGRLGAMTAGFPLWRLRVNLGVLFDEHEDIWRSFMTLLRGSQRRFLAYDLNRPQPRLTRHVLSTGIWSQEIDEAGFAQLTLGAMRPASILSRNDYIGFRWDAAGDEVGTKRAKALVRVMGTTTGSGRHGVAGADGMVTVVVEPPVPTIVPAGAEVYFKKAACIMRQVTGGSQFGDQVPGGYTEQGGVFEAVQDLIR